MIALTSFLLCSVTCAWTFQLPNSCTFHILHKRDWRSQFQWSTVRTDIRLGGKRRTFAHCSKHSCSITSPLDDPTPNTNKISLSPPEHIRNLQIGDKLDAFRRKYVSIEKNVTSDTQYQEVISNFTIERVSYLPDAFVLRNFLSGEESDEIIEMALGKNMTQAETITEGDTKSRTHCQVSWIPSTGAQRSELVSNLVSSTANLLLSKEVLTDPSAGVEDLQVLKYEEGGEFVLHHDGEPRIMTIIYYVNGVGGTWFPLARTHNDESNDPYKSMEDEGAKEAFLEQRRSASQTPLNKREALRLGEGFLPGKNGLLVRGAAGPGKENQHEEEDVSNDNVVSIKRGDALVFYNYVDDGSMQLNWRSLHTGLPATSTKFIANHWFRLNSLLD